MPLSGSPKALSKTLLQEEAPTQLAPILGLVASVGKSPPFPPGPMTILSKINRSLSVRWNIARAASPPEN